MRKYSLILFLLLVTTVSALEIERLTCENLTNPEGVATSTPRLSWVLNTPTRNSIQQSYQLLVASSVEKLNRNEADLWNSGEVTSDQSIYIPYNGAHLTSKSKAYWKVKATTNKGESQWSAIACFSIGLLNQSDWKGKWIGLDKLSPWDSETQWARLSARYFRKEFKRKKPIQSATLSIAGLGLYELYLNGTKIGNQVLAPSATDYTKSVLFNTFDVTTYLQAGTNAVGVTLGNGRFYNMRQNYKPHKIKTFGYPKLLLQLEITYIDGSTELIVSDETWKVTADGPIRSNNDFDGEEYDATKELGAWSSAKYNAKQWQKVDLVQAPLGVLTPQMNENMQVLQTLIPKTITSIGKESYILDMGQNMVGWLAINVQGAKGTKITLRFAETIQADGSLKMDNLRSAKATDMYTLKGEGVEQWEPRFITHGFRYVEVTGYPTVPQIENFAGKVVSDQMEVTGSFDSSNALLNKLHQNAFWGIRGNYKGMPLDCPQRDERQPWLGDHSTGCTGESFLFDNHNLYVKWMNDIAQTQTPEGQLSDIAPPFYQIYFTDNMTWPGTYLQVADMLYSQFGDAAPLITHYPAMKKWLNYMQKRYMTIDYIMTKDKYGDWCVPPEAKEMIHSKDPSRKTDGALIATAYHFYILTLMQKFAIVTNNPADKQEFAALALNVKKAFNDQFYHPEVGQYGNYTVTSNLLPLAFGLVDKAEEERVFQNMIDRIVRTDKLHLSTGVVGTQWLLRELTKRGCADVAYTIATQKDYPSWGYMVGQGATTIWELWNGDTASPKMNSHNHVMLLGDLQIWMYQDLAGIQTHPHYPGFKRLLMKPNPTETLTATKASHQTPYGAVTSKWEIKNGVFTWNLTIPTNTRANILFPTPTMEGIYETGAPAKMVEGLLFVRKEGGRINVEIGSGTYRFTCPYGEVPTRWKAGILTDQFICPNPPFPESHAATIAETKEGYLIASWFGGTKERNPDVCIWTSKLINNRWTTPENVANGVINDTTRVACWNPVLFQVPKGELQLYYKVGPNVAGWKGMLVTSQDGGTTWSSPKELPTGFIGPVKNKPVLINNTLFCPSSTEGGGWSVHFETTKDLGKTWHKVGPINDGLALYTIQPSILTHKDGRLQILCRTKERAIATSWSADKGKTWSPMQKTNLPNNNSGTDAVTLKDGRQLLVYNHVLPNDTLKNGKGARTPLNVSISDNGVTWYATNILEDSPISQYSYPSVIQSADGLVHIVYTWRRKAIKHVVLDPRKLILSKIENMKWPSDRETKAIEVVNNNRYKVSACDWMMLKRQKVGAIELASDIGANGLELDMGSLGKRETFDNKFVEPHFQALFTSECNRVGIELSSIAMSAFYGQSFAKRENYEQLVDECIATMKRFGVKVAFLPMGTESDLIKEPTLYPILIKRLKVVAQKAEAARVVIGIETALPAKEEAKLLDEIHSPSIKSYVNFSSIIKRKGDICAELKILGKARIAQIHATNTDGVWLQNDPQIDLKAIKSTLDKMDWSGWLVLERSRDITDVHNVKWNYAANVAYLKTIFQPIQP